MITGAMAGCSSENNAQPADTESILRQSIAAETAVKEESIDEISYPEGTEGYLDVDIQKVAVSSGHPDNRVVIRFEDGGIPFNPLEQKKPDITLPWKQRPVGGLGVYLILRMMDDVRYAYVDNRNVLTIEKII